MPSLSRLVRDLGIDLGTANTLIWARGRGVVLDEPSVVAVQRSANGALGEVVAVGHEAHQMLGRTPGNVAAIRPLKDGVIADFRLTEEMLRAFIERAVGTRPMVKPKVVVCVPFGLTEVEKRAVHESARAAGAREVRLMNEPMAAAIGAGLPVTEPTGSMIVDIGGGTTEIAVISLGGLVQSASLRVAGDHMNEALARMVREDFGLVIGERVAEDLKLQLGCAALPAEQGLSTVKGRDADGGIPRQATISTDDVHRALKPLVGEIIEGIRRVLEGTPPELAGDVLDRGLVLCGGGALLPLLDRAISEASGLPVVLAEEPLRCVVKGVGAAVEDEQLLGRVVLP